MHASTKARRITSTGGKDDTCTRHPGANLAIVPNVLQLRIETARNGGCLTVTDSLLSI